MCQSSQQIDMHTQVSIQLRFSFFVSFIGFFQNCKFFFFFLLKHETIHA